MQGMMELSEVQWDRTKKVLKGRADVIGSETMKITIALNGYKALKSSSSRGTARLAPRKESRELVDLEITCRENTISEFAVQFKQGP